MQVSIFSIWDHNINMVIMMFLVSGSKGQPLTKMHYSLFPQHRDRKHIFTSLQETTNGNKCKRRWWFACYMLISFCDFYQQTAVWCACKKYLAVRYRYIICIMVISNLHLCLTLNVMVINWLHIIKDSVLSDEVLKEIYM